MINDSLRVLSVFPLTPTVSPPPPPSFSPDKFAAKNPNPSAIATTQTVKISTSFLGSSKSAKPTIFSPPIMLPFLSATLLCSLILGPISPVESSPLQGSESVYDALKAHGMPMGLLPKGVKNFSIDGEGRFEAHLDKECDAQFESELHYERNVSGKLSYGQIGEISGVSAQELFLWFPVKGIRVDVPSSGVIYFDVGVVFKQFSMSLFDTPPECTAAKSTSGGGDTDDGILVAEALSTIGSGKLRYQADEED